MENSNIWFNLLENLQLSFKTLEFSKLPLICSTSIQNGLVLTNQSQALPKLGFKPQSLVHAIAKL